MKIEKLLFKLLCVLNTHNFSYPFVLIHLLGSKLLKELTEDQFVTLSAEDTYNIILVLSRLDPLKSNIIMILVHIAPETVSGTELTKLLGYSPKARTIYRGVLDELEEEGYILVNRQSNQFSIGIDQSNIMMRKLFELVSVEGDEYTNKLLNIMEDI